MTCLFALMMMLTTTGQPKEPQPIEKVLADGIKPGGQPVMVQTHILVHTANGRARNVRQVHGRQG